MQNLDEETQEAIRINLSRYLFKVEAVVRKENGNFTRMSLNNDDAASFNDEQVVVRNKIVSKTIISIYMAFLTYAPVDRRDYLRDNLSIEEDFSREAQNI